MYVRWSHINHHSHNLQVDDDVARQSGCLRLCTLIQMADRIVVNTPWTIGAFEKAESQNLLVALLSFMEPVILTYIPHAGTCISYLVELCMI